MRVKALFSLVDSAGTITEKFRRRHTPTGRRKKPDGCTAAYPIIPPVLDKTMAQIKNATSRQSGLTATRRPRTKLGYRTGVPGPLRRGLQMTPQA